MKRLELRLVGVRRCGTPMRERSEMVSTSCRQMTSASGSSVGERLRDPALGPPRRGDAAQRVAEVADVVADEAEGTGQRPPILFRNPGAAWLPARSRVTWSTAGTPRMAGPFVILAA